MSNVVLMFQRYNIKSHRGPVGFSWGLKRLNQCVIPQVWKAGPKEQKLKWTWSCTSILQKQTTSKKKSLEKWHIWMILRWIWLSRHSFQCSEGSMVDRTLSIWSLTSSPLFPQVRSFKCYVCRSRLSGYHKGHSLHFCVLTEIWQIWFICLSLPLCLCLGEALPQKAIPVQCKYLKIQRILNEFHMFFCLNQH